VLLSVSVTGPVWWVCRAIACINSGRLMIGIGQPHEPASPVEDQRDIAGEQSAALQVVRREAS
jgi:hypothetical protein